MVKNRIRFSIVILVCLVISFGATSYAETPFLATPPVKVTLDEVVETGIKGSRNLQLLRYTVQMLQYQKMDAEDDIKEIDQAGNFSLLPTDPGTIAAGMPNDGSLSEEEWLRIVLTQVQINSTLNEIIKAQGEQTAKQLSEQRKQLLSLIDEIDIQKGKTNLQQEAETEAIELYLTTLFYQIVSVKEQLAFSKEETAYLNNEWVRISLLKEKGLSDQMAVDRAAAAADQKELELHLLQAQYASLLGQLAFQMNWDSSDVELVAEAEEEFRELSFPADYRSWLVNSYAYRLAQEDVKSAEYSEKAAASESFHTRMQKEAEKNAAVQKRDQLYQELYRILVAAHMEAEQSYAKGKQLLEQEKAARNENLLAEKKWDLGLISQTERDKAALSYHKAVMQRKQAAIDYKLKLIEIEAMKRGYFSI